MAKKTRFNVSSKTIIAQGRETVAQLLASSNKDALVALSTLGFDGATFVPSLETAVSALAHAKGAQEMQKQVYLAETRDDQVLVQAGYRWNQELAARARYFMACTDDDTRDIAGLLRFGKLHSARARGVRYQLEAIIPHVIALSPDLAKVGVTADFAAKGKEILAGLAVEQKETAAAAERRRELTEQVGEYELRVSQLLFELTQAEEALALIDPTYGVRFGLQYIRSEQARVEAARQARLVQRLADAPDPGLVLDSE